MASRGSGKSRGRAAERALSQWKELNERRRAYLEAVYSEDQKEEAFQRSAWSRGERTAPADEGRWVLYGSRLIDDPPLRIALNMKGLVDGGTGSTFAALAARGLLRTRKSLMRVRLGNQAGHVEVLHVRMTTKGRAAVRAGTEEPPPEGCLPGETKLPTGTLRAWHWRALTRAYAAGEEGLPSDYGGDYDGIGWRTWRRLVNYRDGALVREREVGPPWGPGPGYLLFMTDAGHRFYEERWEEYRQRYPRINAPHPSGRKLQDTKLSPRDEQVR